MVQSKLVIPEPILGAIRAMMYTGTELIDYYLSKNVVFRDYVATIPLVRMPHGEPSSEMTVIEDTDFINTLARYLNADPTNSAVLLHFHPIRGPSGPDAMSMAERFRTNDRLGRYGIFVGPNGPTFYETDGSDVFPIRSEVSQIEDDPQIRSLQQRVADEFLQLLREQLRRH